METKTLTPFKSKLKAKPPGETKPGKTKSLIFGPPGVGKTWFSLSFPTPYYIDTEGGADLQQYQERLKAAGGAYLGPSDGALDFGFIIAQIEALATEKHPYRTLIIDSITKVYQTCIANEAERLGDKDAFGASKKPGIANMRRLVNWFAKLDMNIWLIAHDIAEWGVDPKTGQRTEIGRQADVWDKIPYELHLSLQAQKRGTSRVAIVRKSRLSGFPDMEAFPLDYGEFASRYGKDFIEAEVKPITLATPEQVAEIQRLLETVKITEAQIEKIFTKSGADRWSDLTTEEATETIDWMLGKLKGGK